MLYICLNKTNKVMANRKGILINVQDETFTEVEVSEKLEDFYKLINCRTIEAVCFNQQNDMFVDEEGLLTLNDSTKFIRLNNNPQPIAGNGLVLGYDDETGRTHSTDLTIEQVKKNVTFMTMEQVRKEFTL